MHGLHRLLGLLRMYQLHRLHRVLGMHGVYGMHGLQRAHVRLHQLHVQHSLQLLQHHRRHGGRWGRRGLLQFALPHGMRQQAQRERRGPGRVARSPQHRALVAAGSSRSGRRARLLVLSAALAGCVPAGRAGTPAPRPPAWGSWERAEPAALGLDTAALRHHQALCEASGADACLVAFRGFIVQEWYGPNYAEPAPTMSSVKSWTGLLAMLLAQEGKLDLDAPASRYIPEWTAGAEAGVTVRQLLTMTAGLRRRFGEEPGPGQSVGYVSDKNAFVLGLPLDVAPGTQWEYSNEGAQLLSPILEAAAGMPLDRYAAEKLFIPLGMTATSLRLDEAGHAWTYADAKTTLRDFAAIGQLMLNGGTWGQRRILPETAVRALVEPIPLNPEYGMLWWLTLDPPGYATVGYLDTNCFVFPTLGLVVARMQARPSPTASSAYVRPETFALFKQIVAPVLSPRPPSGDER